MKSSLWLFRNHADIQTVYLLNMDQMQFVESDCWEANTQDLLPGIVRN